VGEQAEVANADVATADYIRKGARGEVLDERTEVLAMIPMGPGLIAEGDMPSIEGDEALGADGVSVAAEAQVAEDMLWPGRITLRREAPHVSEARPTAIHTSSACPALPRERAKPATPQFGRRNPWWPRPNLTRSLHSQLTRGAKLHSGTAADAPLSVRRPHRSPVALRAIASLRMRSRSSRSKFSTLRRRKPSGFRSQW
jgi:hypothetical protein